MAHDLQRHLIGKDAQYPFDLLTALRVLGMLATRASEICSLYQYQEQETAAWDMLRSAASEAKVLREQISEARGRHTVGKRRANLEAAAQEEVATKEHEIQREAERRLQEAVARTHAHARARAHTHTHTLSGHHCAGCRTLSRKKRRRS